jgi:hypothetical protein
VSAVGPRESGWKWLDSYRVDFLKQRPS